MTQTPPPTGTTTARPSPAPSPATTPPPPAMPEEGAPPATPTRTTPRITVQSTGKLGKDKREPYLNCVVLNVSTGGTLLFSPVKQIKDERVQIELGQPIFPVSRLMHGRIAHCAGAPPELLAVLGSKALIPSKVKHGYLVGIEYTHIEREDRQTLDRFIRQRLQEERKHRADLPENLKKMHTARDRIVYLEKAKVPIWAYVLGFLIGTYELVTGILQGDSDLTIVLHVGVTLGVFWLIGRVAASVWNELDTWRVPAQTIVAHSDGTAETLDEILADADSELDQLEPEEASPAAEGAAGPNRVA